MKTRLNNGEHVCLPDGQEFHLCGRVDTKRVGRVVLDGCLITLSIDENELRNCPTIPYTQRTFSYDSRNKLGIVWRTMKRISDH
jgi:hypothetical protein